MNHYLYRIINRENNKFYVGIHSTKKYYYDTNYYGSGCFKADAKKNPDKYLRVLITQAESREELAALEVLFITQELVDDPMCYNMRLGGIGGSAKGTASQEAKDKMSAAMKGKKKSDEHKAKMSAAQKGKVLTDEQKAAISAAMKGNKNSLGIIRTDEQKDKVSAAQKGRVRTAAQNQAMSVRMKEYYRLKKLKENN